MHENRKLDSIAPDSSGSERSRWYGRVAAASLAASAAVAASDASATEFLLNGLGLPNRPSSNQQLIYFNMQTGATEVSPVFAGVPQTDFGSDPTMQFALFKSGAGWIGLYARGANLNPAVAQRYYPAFNNQVMATTPLFWSPGSQPTNPAGPRTRYRDLVQPVMMTQGQTVGFDDPNSEPSWAIAPPRTNGREPLVPATPGNPWSPTHQPSNFTPTGFNVLTLNNANGWGAPGAHGFIGLRFAADNNGLPIDSGSTYDAAAGQGVYNPGNDANFYYGFIEVFRDSANTLQFLRMGYNPELGQPMVLPALLAVPEPTSTSLLVMGAIGLAAYRARRKKRQESESQSTAV